MGWARASQRPLAGPLGTCQANVSSGWPCLASGLPPVSIESCLLRTACNCASRYSPRPGGQEESLSGSTPSSAASHPAQLPSTLPCPAQPGLCSETHGELVLALLFFNLLHLPLSSSRLCQAIFYLHLTTIKVCHSQRLDALRRECGVWLNGKIS